MGHLRKELEVLKEGHRSVQMHAQASFQCCSDLIIVGFSHYSVLKSLQQLPSRAGNSGLTSRKRTVTELKIEVSLEGYAGPWGKTWQCLPTQAEPDSGHWGCRPLPVRQARLPWFRSPEGTCPVAPTSCRAALRESKPGRILGARGLGVADTRGLAGQ